MNLRVDGTVESCDSQYPFKCDKTDETVFEVFFVEVGIFWFSPLAPGLFPRVTRLLVDLVVPDDDLLVANEIVHLQCVAKANDCGSVGVLGLELLGHAFVRVAHFLNFCMV